MVGQTRCGKTSFVQNLGKNKIFCDIKAIEWISKVELSKKREHQLCKSFPYPSVEFHYPHDVVEFETILDYLKDEKNVNVENDVNVLGENDVFDCLIVMDDVSGLADKSSEFCNFLTVSRKYGYTCVYTFHIVFPSLSKWQMILSQTKIFNIFPSVVQRGNMSRILTNSCDGETLRYIPKRELWINRLYFEITSKKDYLGLTTDCGQSGPAKYRTEADNNVQQTCFFSQKKKDRLFDRFVANNLNRDNLIFTIETTDKNHSIKERHLPYDQLFEKSNDKVQEKSENDRATTTASTDRLDHRHGAKSRKLPRFLFSGRTT